MVTDDALPRGSIVTVTWTKLNGPGAVTFADEHAATTTATFSLPGIYTLRLSATDTEFTTSDDMVVNVSKNEPPVVNAGADLEMTLPNTAALGGTATDDGLPRGQHARSLLERGERAGSRRLPRLSRRRDASPYSTRPARTFCG